MIWRKHACGCLLVLFVVFSPAKDAWAINADWEGSVSSDYFNPANWKNGQAPVTAGDGVTVGVTGLAIANFPVYNGDNSGTPAGAVNIGSTLDGSFTMSGGTFAASGGLDVGKADGVAGTLTVTSGVMNIGRFNTSRVSGADANIVISGGEINVAATDGNAVLFAAEGGANQPSTNTTITMSGGTITSNGRIRFGRSNSDSATADNPTATVNMSGGLMWAKGTDGNGTINFQGGKINFSGGVLRGGDISSASGFNRNVANGKQGGVDFLGGVLEIETDITEGVVYAVPAGGDLSTTTGTALQRGQNRALGFARDLTIERFHTTLPNHIVQAKVQVDPTGPGSKDIARVFATVKGDFNVDGVVDAADYTVWRDTLGTTYYDDNLDPTANFFPYFGADGDGDGIVGASDLTVWQTNFGLTAVGGPFGFGAAAIAAVAVPEPGSAVIVAASLATVFGARARRRRSFLV